MSAAEPHAVERGRHYGEGESAATSLTGCVKSMAILGALLFAAYAAFVRNLAGWDTLGWWALQGAFAGALAGVLVYAALLVLRVLAAVLGLMIKLAVFAALIFGVLYLLGLTS